MFCRKCGSKKTTRRSAGVFICQRCGMQPGQLQMDRAGNAALREEYPDPSPIEYVFAARSPRLLAGKGTTNAQRN